MATPSGPRPGNIPPIYTPNSLPNNMQDLQINQPNLPQPTNPTGGASRPPITTPFGQQPPPFAVTRPGPPVPSAFMRGPDLPSPSGPPNTLSPNVASTRPTGPPPGSHPSPRFTSRPLPPGSLPSSMGGATVSVASGSSPQLGPGPHQRPFLSSPLMSGPAVPPPLSTSGPLSNGLHRITPAQPQDGTRFPPVRGSTPRPPPIAAPQPAGMLSSGSSSQHPQVWPNFGGPSAGASLATVQPGPPSAPRQYSPPSPAPSPFSAPIQSVPPSLGSPYGMQTWMSQQQQVAPPPPFPGLQPPRMFGMPPPLPNQSMAPTSPALGHTGASVTAQSKVDLNHIPRPIPSSLVILHETRQGDQANPPPPATSDYIVKDTGNCSPRFMRCTINQIPCTVDLLSTSAMQLALLVQPLALPHPSEEPIQVVDFGESGPVRCSRCKGYINPFMKFIDQGWRFVCNFCGFTDETPRDYHCNLGPDGRRRDADERPELCRGTVEFVASKEYMVKELQLSLNPQSCDYHWRKFLESLASKQVQLTFVQVRDPMPAVYFFLIDVSMNAIQTGATAAACSAISQVIADLPDGPRTAVGIATFDSNIHFYNLKRALQQPLMLIVPDIQDVYTPLENDVIVQLSECRQHLEILLESIPMMFQNNRIADSAFGAAIKAAFLAMKSTGGKLLVFQSVLPSIGTGFLSAREAEGWSNISAGEKEANKLLQPADKTLKTMAIEFAEYQVCVDLFITTQTYVDIASISVIPRTTGGQMYYYYPFTALSDPAKLYNDLRWNVTRPQGFEAVMRVRCSQGIQVQDYSGNFCKRIPTDVDLPAIDCDKTIMVTLKHDDKLQDGSECAFQCALLYTNVYGQRRIRVSTLSLPCTNMLSNLFQFSDLDTQFACILKQVTSAVPSTPLPQVTEQPKNLCMNILHSYRKFCASASASGQLILPEALKLLPLYTLGLLKSCGLQADGRIDDRSFWINYVSHLSTHLTIPLVYPRMIAIHNLDEKEMDDSLIPETVPLSSEHITDEGIYLLENGEDCLIYVGNSVNPDILSQLLGISSVEEISSQFILQQYDNPLSKKLNNIVNEIRRQRSSYLRLKLCRKGDPSGTTFLSYMVEDKTPGRLSYVEFLIHTHQLIQRKTP